MPSRGSKYPSEQRFCEIEGQTTEWRLLPTRKREDGSRYQQWRCISCQNKADRRAKAARSATKSRHKSVDQERRAS